TKTLDVTGTGRISSTFTLTNVSSCTGSQALQTNASGDISCGAISVSGSTSGGGWNASGGAVNGKILEATSTYVVAIGSASSSPYAQFSVTSGSTASTTLALLPASSQTANIIDIYDTAGNLASVLTAGGKFGLGTTSPSQVLSVQGNGL